MAKPIITVTCRFCCTIFAPTVQTPSNIAHQKYCSLKCVALARNYPYPMSMGERFNFHVQWTPGCWVWVASKTNGYGMFDMALGVQSHERVRIYAHIFSYIIHNGPIPAGLCVLHRCDNPPCVNPDHLFLGTKADNVRDMINKDRTRYVGIARGTKMKKVSDSQVREIRLRYSNGEPPALLAKEMQLGYDNVIAIARYRSRLKVGP